MLILPRALENIVSAGMNHKNSTMWDKIANKQKKNCYVIKRIKQKSKRPISEERPLPKAISFKSLKIGQIGNK